MAQLNFIEQGLRVLNIERQALADITQYVDENFHSACQLMFDCQGRIIVIGMGKSGHIGNKIAATLASTWLCLYQTRAKPAKYLILFRCLNALAQK
jgi:arabinose-5-phosphate isomerase